MELPSSENYWSDVYRVPLPTARTDTPDNTRGCAWRQASEDFCTAAAETVGDGLCPQGSGAPRREGDAWVVTAILLVDWRGRER